MSVSIQQSSTSEYGKFSVLIQQTEQQSFTWSESLLNFEEEGGRKMMENCQDYVSHEMITWMETIRKCDITTQKIHAVSKTKQAAVSNLLQ